MTAQTSSPIPPQALAGIKVIELGQLIAGPFAGKTLADFGADVIKIEPPASEGSPGGDPLRQWRMLHQGTSVWWQVQSRNKQSVVLDLRTEQGREAVRHLIDEADVVIENFKPGTMEKWGLGFDELSRTNPGLIMLRISGYGQTGPYRERPGFAVVAEAMGGMRYLNAEPGRVPVRAGVSLGDTLAALHGVIGVLLALQARHASVSAAAPKGRGQVVDVALYEAVFNCMESLLPEYSAFGAVRQPAGSALPGIAPSNAYPCADGMVVIGGNGDSIFKRLMIAIGRTDLSVDAELATNPGRVQRVGEIDEAIGAWTAQRPVSEVVDVLNAVSVPVGRIYSARDIAEDPHYLARDMIVPVTTHDGLTVQVPGVIPKLSATPGLISRRAPTLGEDTERVLGPRQP
ncbi:CaiB/BaiF CoA-transferase family protein [Aquabacterium sp. CECT 9606]|uniref:CaiB/BaiF CoA transferase family protein n=1 Tax=Aquabacterium sp. CECT 9606 TaxID=2845822 RepID=UPI001E4DCB16|nr:CoA transferase [Aquabacterium sp. CECT 9606]CAH0348899.1 Succinyl-CoA--L-malate CoA-transferase beta subunit [Aquabacterium sp. CECT 9606]